MANLALDVGGRAVPIKVISAEVDVGEVIQSMVDTLSEEESQNSFYVADIGKVLDLYDLWKDTFPKIRPFYAVKCNADPLLIKTLASLGTGFDCASKQEIEAVLDQGVSPDRVVFNSSFKFIPHIKYAQRVGVKVMTFDSETELLKIKEHYPSAKLMLRLRPENYDEYSGVKMEGLLYKFGCTLDVAKSLLQRAKSMDMDVIGVGFHLGIGKDGVNCSSLSSYLATLKVAEEVMCYGEELGLKFTLLDIGGGFRGLSGMEDDIRKLSISLNKAVEDITARHPSLERVIAEPGRYFCCSVYTLVVCVIGTKVADDGSVAYVLSDGRYHTFNMLRSCPLHPLSPTPLNKSREISSVEECKDVYLWGPALAADAVMKSTTSSFPALQAGDWVIFENMGAYTMTLWIPFHLLPKPKVYYFAKDSKSEQMKTILPCDESIVAYKSA